VRSALALAARAVCVCVLLMGWGLIHFGRVLFPSVSLAAQNAPIRNRAARAGGVGVDAEVVSTLIPSAVVRHRFLVSHID